MKYINNGIMCTIPDYPVRTIEERIRRLEDINSIKECIYHYMHYCDRLEPEGMASVFTEDGKLSWGDDLGYIEGRDAILAHLKEIMGAARTQTHYSTNEQIYFDGPDSAIMYCCMYSWQTFLSEDIPDCYSFGRYESKLVRDKDGEWRFASFKLIYAGAVGSDRSCEQFNRPWPPIPIGE